MKLEALDHPKTLDLCTHLHVELPTAIGHLELLWAWTGKKTPQGNVGKFPDGAIAVACFWRGEPHQFIDGLVAAGLLDRHPQHRLVVHDWHDHAPNWVKAKLSKAKQSFLTHRGVSSSVSASVSDDVSEGAADDTGTDTATDTSSDTRTDTRSSRARVLPSEVKGSEVKPSSASRVRTGADQSAGASTGRKRETRDFDPEADHAAFQQVKAAYPKFAGRQNWIQAEHYCHLRLDDGATWDELLAGVERYAKHIRALGKEGTQHVIRPENFFNAPDRPWSQDWDLPEEPKQPKPLNGTRRLTPGEIIEQAILDGRSDDEIVALPELELWPTVREDIRNMRQEIAGA